MNFLSAISRAISSVIAFWAARTAARRPCRMGKASEDMETPPLGSSTNGLGSPPSLAARRAGGAAEAESVASRGQDCRTSSAHSDHCASSASASTARATSANVGTSSTSLSWSAISTGSRSSEWPSGGSSSGCNAIASATSEYCSRAAAAVGASLAVRSAFDPGTVRAWPASALSTAGISSAVGIDVDTVRTA